MGDISFWLFKETAVMALPGGGKGQLALAYQVQLGLLRKAVEINYFKNNMPKP